MESIPKGTKREQLNPARFEGREPQNATEMRISYQSAERAGKKEEEVESEEEKVARIKERLQNIREQEPRTPDEWRRKLIRIIDRGGINPVNETRTEKALTKNEQDFFKLNTRVKELEDLTGLTETPEHVRELEIKRPMRDALRKEMGRQTSVPQSYMPPLRNYTSPIRKPSFGERIRSWFKNPFGF